MLQSESAPLISDEIRSRPTARAEAALTHPATLVAIATLIVNDLVFKPMWPGIWITGKLSDLAWMIFAPPLVALPLTFLARRDQTGQRVAWATAYIGLPLLYAAYNSYEPLHDVVMTVFSVLRGTPGGSPFDPSDSIVIPFAMATAIWVWRNTNPNNKAARLRFGLLLAAIASSASVATSFPAPYIGVVDIEADVDGSPSYIRHWGGKPDVSRRFVDTPRGTYSIHGTDILRSDSRSSEIVFSTIIKNESRDLIALRASTINLGERIISVSPYSIYYDEASGNVILAMGLQGVVIGKPDGTWERTPVEDLKPLDYSIASRLSTLLHIIELNFISAGLAASFTIFTLVLATRSTEASWGRFFLMLAVSVPVGVSIIALLHFSDMFDPRTAYDLRGFAILFAWMLPIPFVLAISKLKFLTAATTVIAAFIGMFVLSEFAFFLWVNGVIGLDNAKLGSLFLTAFGAVVLGIWTKSYLRLRAQRDAARIRLSTDRMQ